MQPGRYKDLSVIENVLWWHKARRETVVRILRRLELPKNATALDVGCGTGGAFKLFDRLGISRCVGFDFAWNGVRIAKDKWRDNWLVQADASKNFPFGDESFDLVTVFGMLHHVWIEDEFATVRQIATLLRPNGVLVITEPAFPVLYRHMDAVTMTKRRYYSSEITDMARQAELVPVRTGYFAFIAFFPVLAVSLLERLFRFGRRGVAVDHSSVPLDFRMPPRWLNNIFYFLTILEGRAIAAGLRLPVGVTIIGVYQKPPQCDQHVEYETHKI